MTTHTRARRALARPAALLTAVASAALLAGCGAGSEHNDADVAFATQMIPHHAQAVEMAEMVDGEDVDPEVAELAADIEAAQAPEIETMTGWLEEWGEEVPATDGMSGMSGMGEDHEGHDMAGMMSPADMEALADADGEEFQTMWLEMMIEHHRGAIEMAATEQEDGEYDDAVELAARIEETQASEIATMEDLLDAS